MANFEANYRDLLQNLTGQREQVPGIGSLPEIPAQPVLPLRGTQSDVDTEGGVELGTEPLSIALAGSRLLFRIAWRNPPYNTLTLHLDQPLFENYPGDWFYRGRADSACPQFYALLLSCPGITSVMRESPYELLMGKAELAQYDVVLAHINEALKTATGIQQISRPDPPATATGASGPSTVPVQITVQPTAYTDGDWITAAIVARERAETELKKVASRARRSTITKRAGQPDRSSQRETIVNLLQSRIRQLLRNHAQGGTTDDTRLEACTAKVVADILKRELVEFEWAADERSQHDPALVFRDTIKTIGSRYR
jgi:hypothetical protein